MIVVALAGLVANAIVVLLLRSHSEGSLAVKGAYMEVVADTVGSIGVLIAGIVTVTTQLAVRRRRGRGVRRTVGAAARDLAGAGGAADPVRVLAQPHRRRGAAHRAVRGRRRDRGARPARVDAGARQGHGHRAPDQSAADSAQVLDDARAVLTARGLEHATVQVEPPDAAGDCNCEASW